MSLLSPRRSGTAGISTALDDVIFAPRTHVPLTNRRPTPKLTARCRFPLGITIFAGVGVDPSFHRYRRELEQRRRFYCRPCDRDGSGANRNGLGGRAPPARARSVCL